MNYELLMNKAREAGFEALEIYVSKKLGMQITVFGGEVDQNNITDSQSFTIRGIYKGKMAVYTTEYAAEDPDYIVERLKENAGALTTDEEFAIFEGSPSYPEG
ncbi:MAG: DNA gyrase modulator, partial [Bacilli bacterium]